MNCKSSYTISILKTLIFVCLAIIFFIFYFTDVIHKFAERDTTLILSQETVEENTAKPIFITFCMQPRAKRTILDGYKLSTGVLDEPNQNDVEILASLNKTVETLFREVTVKINVDFELDIRLWYYEDANGWKNYTGKMHEGSNYIKVL